MSNDISQEKIFGIDLGTTYSSISWIDPDGRVAIIPDPDDNGALITPSYVFFESESNVIVGQVAKDSARAAPANAVSFIKRFMGLTREEWENDPEPPKLHQWGKDYTPEEISSLILKKLAKNASAVTQTPVKKVVITCPAYFGKKERDATATAGKIAGLEVVQVLDEPAAAALCYALDGSQEKALSEKNILVYDLGGGTFDATVLQITAENEIKVVWTQGDHRLGGKDWDERIKIYLAEQFNKETGNTGDIRDDIDTAYDLEIGAEKLKKLLSGRDVASHTIVHGGDRVTVSLARQEFDERTSDLLEKTYKITDEVLQNTEGRCVSKIDEILLVGGSTQMRQVKEGVKQRYGTKYAVEPRQYEPNTAVAKGAALFACAKSIIPFMEDEFKKLIEEAGGSSNITPQEMERFEEIAAATASAKLGMSLEKFKNMHKAGEGLKLAATKSYGIELLVAPETGECRVFKMIEWNQPLPYEVHRTASTVVDNQSVVDFKIFSYETTDDDIDPNICDVLGNGVLSLPPGMPGGTPLRASMTLTEKGELHFEGELMQKARGDESNVVVLETFNKEKVSLIPTGRIKDFTITVKGGMTEDEIIQAASEVSAMTLG